MVGCTVEMHVDEIGIIVSVFLFYVMNKCTSKKGKKIPGALSFLSQCAFFFSLFSIFSFVLFSHQNDPPFSFSPFD